MLRFFAGFSLALHPLIETLNRFLATEGTEGTENCPARRCEFIRTYEKAIIILRERCVLCG